MEQGIYIDVDMTHPNNVIVYFVRITGNNVVN